MLRLLIKKVVFDKPLPWSISIAHLLFDHCSLFDWSRENAKVITHNLIDPLHLRCRPYFIGPKLWIHYIDFVMELFICWYGKIRYQEMASTIVQLLMFSNKIIGHWNIDQRFWIARPKHNKLCRLYIIF